MVNANQMKHAANLAVWKERIVECRASGIPVKAWCSQKGWNASTYYRWEREICGRLGKRTPSEPQADADSTALVPASDPSLVEIPVVQSEPRMVSTQNHPLGFSPVAVVRKGSLELTLANGISPQLMKQLEALLDHAE